MMWTANFRKLCLVNAMLFALLFMGEQWHSSFSHFLWLLFIGVCLPGLFFAHLSDAFRRKHICAIGFLMVCACSVGLQTIHDTPYVALLWLFQGVGLGLATGMLVTLGVDVVASEYRSRANACYLLSTCFGLFAGFLLPTYFPHYIVHLQPVFGVLGLLLLLSMYIPFRAPLGLAWCSFDRFLLPRTLPLMLNVLPLGMLLPLIVSFNLYQPGRVVCVALSFVMGLGFQRFFNRVSTKWCGLMSLLGLPLFLLAFHLYQDDLWCAYLFLFLSGACLLLSLLSLLQLFLGLTQHCQRATANYSYLLSLFAGVLVGLLFIEYFADVATSTMLVCCSLAALFLFAFSALYCKKIKG